MWEKTDSAIGTVRTTLTLGAGDPLHAVSGRQKEYMTSHDCNQQTEEKVTHM